MNFITYEDTFKQILSKGKGQTKSGKPKDLYHRGMYIFSRGPQDTFLKIGMAWGASGVFERLKRQYKICHGHPDEFYIHFLVLVLEPKQARKIEKKFLKMLKPIPHENNKKNKEWKSVLNRQELKDKLREMLNTDMNDWFALLVFSEKNVRVISSQTIEQLSYSDMNKPSNTRALHKI